MLCINDANSSELAVISSVAAAVFSAPFSILVICSDILLINLLISSDSLLTSLSLSFVEEIPLKTISNELITCPV